MKKYILFFGFALLLFQSPASAQFDSFSLRNLDGDLIDSNEYIGKGPVLLDFWATWCKPCLKNLPKLQKLYDDYSEKGLVILAVNEDGTRSLSKVEPLANSLGLTFPVLIDEDRDVMRKYQVSGLPTSILIDKNENIVLTLRGYRPGDEKQLRQHLDVLFEGEGE
jgi:cytochrome c biogenesis protein CcmG, thiol:disulfide interchange protein DsbE